MTEFSIRTDILKAIAPCVHTEETRYHLNGVWIEPADIGILVVATDGRRMGVFHDSTGSAPRGAIVSLRFRDALLRSGRVLKFTLPETPGFTAGIVRDADPKRTGSFGAVLVEEIDGKFPDWRKVLPRSGGQASASFDGKLLAEIAAAANSAFGRGPMHISAASASDPAIVTFNECRFGFYVLMPMRSDLTERTQLLPIPDDVLRPHRIAAE